MILVSAPKDHTHRHTHNHSKPLLLIIFTHLKLCVCVCVWVWNLTLFMSPRPKFAMIPTPPLPNHFLRLSCKVKKVLDLSKLFFFSKIRGFFLNILPNLVVNILSQDTAFEIFFRYVYDIGIWNVVFWLGTLSIYDLG